MSLRSSAVKKIKILSEGFLSANSQGLLWPLSINRALLRDNNFDLEIVTNISEGIEHCDALLIDSKYFRDYWDHRSSEALDLVSRLSETIDSLLWFHTGDSGGALGSYCRSILPLVKGIYKNQIFADKTNYQRSLYGNRLFTDYYHQCLGIEDDEEPECDTILSDDDLTKINVSWNIGYARCFHYFGEYFSQIYNKLPLNALLRVPPKIHSVNRPRPRGIFSRMALSFPRRTIGYQRAHIAELLGSQPRVSRRKYYKEMKESKIVLSPFGWGEINNRDFEGFIYGCLLIKPTLSHLITYPNFFSPWSTYIPYKWDMSDLEEVIEEALEKYSSHRDIALEGQRSYVKATLSRAGSEQFVEHFTALINKATS